MSDVMQNTSFAQLQLTLDIHFRLAQKSDLPKLEWLGEYTHFRRMFSYTFKEQQTGRRLMLIADFNAFPIGHIFLLVKDTGFYSAERGYLYSLRVMEPFRGKGIGTALIRQAEKLLLDHSLHYATIAVAKDNPGALRLYQREGYDIYDDDEGRWSYQDHEGNTVYVHEPCWMLEKKLR